MRKFEVFTTSDKKIQVEADKFMIIDSIASFHVGEEGDKKKVAAFNMGFVEGIKEVVSE